MTMSQREAARAWGVSRATLQRYIAAGKLSLTTEKLVDPAEMVRAFGEPKRPQEPAQPDRVEPLESTNDPAQSQRIAVLEAEISGLRATLAAKDSHIIDLRSQVQLLTHDSVDIKKIKRRWWQLK